jgi:nucleotide-binding universal stress UspA family protein
VARHGDHADQAVERERSAMTEVLGCVDFSDASDAVVVEAVRLARSAGNRLHLIHVAAGEPALAGYDEGPVAAHTRDDRAHELTDEHHRLRELAATYATDGLEIVPLLIMGPTVETILAEAERIDAATIVIGSHGHGALRKLLLGSISQGVVRHSPRPVVIVPVGER